MDIRALQGLLLVLWAVVVVAAGEKEVKEEAPVVRVAGGALRGKRITRPPSAPLRTLYAFEGVPYARPPTGPLRFKDPEEAEPWTGIKDATNFGPNCIQKNIGTGEVSGSEDCLYLNIYTADPPHEYEREKRPVIIFIHGGAFTQWSGDLKTENADPFLLKKTIFVIFNYRLGIMGFLNTEDAQAPGNAGLKDQAMAFRWVQRNIAAFGGDPRNVTIMGESAGGASVNFHLISSYSKGLFQKAVSASGSVLAPWAFGEAPRASVLAVRRHFAAACPGAAPDEVVSCLQRVPARDLVNDQWEVPLQPYQHYFGKFGIWRPTAEAANSSPKPFLTEDAEHALRKGYLNEEIPYMTGFTSAEGILYLAWARLLEDPSRWAEVDAHFEDIFRWEMPQGLRTKEAARAVRDFYLGNRSLADASDDPDTVNRFVQMLTDMTFALGTISSARYVAQRGANVYLYMFNRDGPIGFTKQAMNATSIPGVTHGDDMVYLFDYLQPNSSEARHIPATEQPIRERQITLITNMAKFGNPTPEGSDLKAWPVYTAASEDYVDMDVQLTVRQHVLHQRIAFWRRLLDARGDHAPAPAPASSPAPSPA